MTRKDNGRYHHGSIPNKLLYIQLVVPNENLLDLSLGLFIIRLVFFQSQLALDSRVVLRTEVLGGNCREQRSTIPQMQYRFHQEWKQLFCGKRGRGVAIEIENC